MAEHVLVLGGGLAGVACAQKLGDEGVDVTLVDPTITTSSSRCSIRWQARIFLPRTSRDRIGRSLLPTRR
jgi:2-polyprenyl-6-methoxyphenol hydroxylase-like FAD-dependent oxidoreductase